MTSVIDRLSELYTRRDVEVDLAALLGQFPSVSEDDLADLVEFDGRRRIEMHRSLALDRYLQAVPDLRDHPLVLDAAIDVVLRSMYSDNSSQSSAVEALVREHPDLEAPIREAAALTNAIWSTAHIREQVSVAPRRELPAPFGPPLEDGTTRYELRQLLGEGAFGQVYLAVDRQLSEPDHEALVAIKVLATPDRSPWARQRLIDEATKARRIEHPNVVRVLDRGVTDGNEDYIVGEYVDGGDLAARIRGLTTPMPVRDAVQLVVRIARGVQAAHAAGLVHCDLKPGNIMLTATGEPKVADFGVAVRRGESIEASRGIDEDHPIGNIAFISPEQYRMEPDALHAGSDIYALGGILYLLLTGKLPNGKTASEIASTHDRATGRTSAPGVRHIRPEVDGDLQAVCRRALSPMPDGRYSSAGEFARDLELWLERQPISWTRPSQWRVFTLWVRRRPAAAIMVLAILAALVTGSLLWINAAKRAATMNTLVRLQDLVRPRMREGINVGEEILGGMWLLEELYGPRLLNFSGSADEVRAMRIEFATDLLDQAQAEGGENAVQMLMWETALAYWLVNDEQPQPALEVLARNRSGWAAIGVLEDDPWHLDLEAIELCAKAQLALSQPDDAEVLRSLAQLLEAHNTRYHETAFRAKLRILVVDSLIALYGESGLNDAARLETTTNLRTFLDGNKPKSAMPSSATP